MWKDSYLPCQEEDCALTFTSTLIQYNSQHNITSNSYAGRLKLNPQNLANYPAQQYCRSIGGQLPTIDQARAILANYQLAIPTTPHGSNVLGLVTSEYDFSTNYASNSLVQSGYIYKYVMKYSGNQINACTQDCFYTGISRLDHLGTNSYVLCIK